MAKKKTAIGDLIKSDMSRRSIGEETEVFEKPELIQTAEPVGGERPDKNSAEEKPFNARPPEDRPPAVKAASPLPAAPRPVAEGSAAFTEFIAGQARSAGLTGESDLRKFYDFMQGQATRYIRGFNAGRRFYG